MRAAAERHHSHWDPSQPPPGGSWRRFFFEYEESWLEWSCAGQNVENIKQGCLIGVYGTVYDVSFFLDEHPGTPETILDNAGGDTTEFFEDVGHSTSARRRMKSLAIVHALPPLYRIMGQRLTASADATPNKAGAGASGGAGGGSGGRDGDGGGESHPHSSGNGKAQDGSNGSGSGSSAAPGNGGGSGGSSGGGYGSGSALPGLRQRSDSGSSNLMAWAFGSRESQESQVRG